MSDTPDRKPSPAKSDGATARRLMRIADRGELGLMVRNGPGGLPLRQAQKLIRSGWAEWSGKYLVLTEAGRVAAADVSRRNGTEGERNVAEED